MAFLLPQAPLAYKKKTLSFKKVKGNNQKASNKIEIESTTKLLLETHSFQSFGMKIERVLRGCMTLTEIDELPSPLFFIIYQDSNAQATLHSMLMKATIIKTPFIFGEKIMGEIRKVLRLAEPYNCLHRLNSCQICVKNCGQRFRTCVSKLTKRKSDGWDFIEYGLFNDF